MALPIRDFRGKIDGLMASNYVKQLDYTLKTSEERLEKVKEILKNPVFFDKYFSEYHKVNVNREDFLSGDKNICKSIEKFADYLLLSNDVEETIKDKNKRWKIKYVYYTDEKLGKKIAKDYNKRTETIMFLVDKNKNYRKQAKQQILNSDLIDKDFESEVKIYNINSPEDYRIETVNNFKEYSDLKGKLKEVINKIDNGTYNTKNSSEPLYKIKKSLKENLNDLKKELLLFKDKTKGTIYFNHCLPESEEIIWDLFNFTDKEHVLALLKLTNSNLLTDKGVLVHDINKLIVSAELSDFELEVIELWRINDYTQETIADTLKVSQQFISSTLKSISDKIVQQYKEKYEDWLYLNYIKGTYKKCSKCGEIKLIQRFNKDSSRKDGYMYICKKCESVGKNTCKK